METKEEKNGESAGWVNASGSPSNLPGLLPIDLDRGESTSMRGDRRLSRSIRLSEVCAGRRRTGWTRVTTAADGSILGDFNFIRGPENRSRAGGDHNNMMVFNNIIINLDLVEIPLKGRAFTWSNMQDQPLLEKLDWVFTSPQWTSEHPYTMVIPLAKITSNHVPIKVQIDSNIPKCQIFRFEEFWTEFTGFIDTVENHWNNSKYFVDSTKNI